MPPLPDSFRRAWFGKRRRRAKFNRVVGYPHGCHQQRVRSTGRKRESSQARRWGFWNNLHVGNKVRGSRCDPRGRGKERDRQKACVGTNVWTDPSGRKKRQCVGQRRAGWRAQRENRPCALEAGRPSVSGEAFPGFQLLQESEAAWLWRSSEIGV